MRALKFERRAHAAYPLAGAMARVAEDEGWAGAADVVAAVPLHARKRRERGFNQAEAIARDLAERIGVPYRELLRRVRDTAPQGAETTLSRARNVEGALPFALPLSSAVPRNSAGSPSSSSTTS